MPNRYNNYNQPRPQQGEYDYIYDTLTNLDQRNEELHMYDKLTNQSGQRYISNRRMQPPPASNESGVGKIIRVIGIFAVIALIAGGLLFASNLLGSKDEIAGEAENTVHTLVKDGNTIADGSDSGLFSIIPGFSETPANIIEVEDVPVTVDTSQQPAGTQVLPPQYYRSMLDTQHQEAYDQILIGMKTMQTDIPITLIPGDNVGLVFEAVLNDSPDIFWVGLEYSYSQDQYGQAHDVIVNYTMDEALRAEYQRNLDQVAAEIKSVADTGVTTYDKVKWFYDVLCRDATYDLNAPNNQNMVGALVDHRAACAGYARAFQYLCYLSGISCTYMTGTGDDGTGPVSHAWNAVEIDGIVTYVDVTWGDQASDDIPNDYAYLCLTMDDMLRTGHVFAHPEWAPASTDPRYEYWAIHNGYHDVYDYSAVLSRCLSGIASGEVTTYMRFAAPEMLEAAYNDFVATPTGANDIVSVNPAMSTHVTGQPPYSAFRVEEINVIVFVWHN